MLTRAPATPPEGRKRKHRPLRVELRATLRAAGIDPDQPYEFQHEPPLGLRPFNPATNDYDPPENDDRHLRPMQKLEHKKVTKEVDRPAVDKARRQAKGQRKHYLAMMTPESWPLANAWVNERLADKPRSKWAKGRKIRSRGFQKREARR